VIERATAVLHALASSDVDALSRLCRDDVLIWGTDEGEEWQGRAAVLSGFDGAYDLSVRWLGSPTGGAEWVAGLVEFGVPDGEPVQARVTMVFAGDLLAHAHYSVALPPSG
jgi:ketosteroid isomerase-like protein